MSVNQSEDINEVSFQPGDILFRENEQSFHFYIIQEGQVEVFKLGPNGQNIILATVGESTSIGEFAMIDRLPRSATARALTPVRAARVSEEAYQQLLQELPDWAVSVLRALVERIRHMNEVVRRAGSNNSELQMQVDSVEFDTNTSTIRDDNPLLGSDDED